MFTTGYTVKFYLNYSVYIIDFIDDSTIVCFLYSIQTLVVYIYYSVQVIVFVEFFIVV